MDTEPALPHDDDLANHPEGLDEVQTTRLLPDLPEKPEAMPPAGDPPPDEPE